MVKPRLEGKLVNLVNMNSAPLGVLSIVKLLEIMLKHHKCHLHKNPIETLCCKYVLHSLTKHVACVA
jgi:hypothetical protein